MNVRLRKDQADVALNATYLKDDFVTFTGEDPANTGFALSEQLSQAMIVRRFIRTIRGCAVNNGRSQRIIGGQLSVCDRALLLEYLNMKRENVLFVTKSEK